MKIDILQVPYHLDREGVNTGVGPAHLLDSGLSEALSAAGHEVGRVAAVKLDRDHGHETGNIFAVARELAELVRSSRREGSFPLVLAGDCYSVIGVVSGLETGQGRGLVWLDAHGDAHTPETTPTGFFDGMPLAVALGWCWSSLARTLPSFEPLAEQRVVHLGGRAFDDGEEAVLAASGMTFINGGTMRGDEGVAKSIEAVTVLGQESDGVHVHLDLDVLDESDGIASGYAVGGGPSLAGLEETISAIGSSCEVI
jgi:arginase